jgi:hypothetical protein
VAGLSRCCCCSSRRHPPQGVPVMSPYDSACVSHPKPSTHTHTHKHTHTHTHTNTHIHTYMHACIHTCIHACIHIHINIYITARACGLWPWGPLAFSPVAVLLPVGGCLALTQRSHPTLSPNALTQRSHPTRSARSGGDVTFFFFGVFFFPFFSMS